MFEEVIAPFHFEYFIEKYVGINPSTFKSNKQSMQSLEVFKNVEGLANTKFL
jgi:hypothetical protein